ncbi:AraC family transcriptional regulator N-terminal domain-containing protein [Rodentibacter pneumotropicus]|uniref:AraC family transcriptional regulator n=1 Tax=Rodentibacter pneumotropicus TaxID=758 RepID=UPI00232F6B4D|nr:AraC family transcriptional regulator N-terminal domain-containing protein [Rodentibacter pneumotropicus]MDC2826049.1 AraC family transcriptional regulator N-terminal domain-containing protein [Rodentibacter pneumotropicus]
MTISKTPEKLTALYEQLVTKVLPYTPKEGRIHTKIEGLSFYRHDNPNYSLPCVQPLGIVVALQGRKEISLGNKHICYEVGQILFIGANISGFSYMPECSLNKPFLGLALEFDFNQLSHLACTLELSNKNTQQQNTPNRIFNLFDANEKLLESLSRLVDTLQEETLIQPLAELIKHEIALRIFHAHPELVALLKDGTATHKIIETMVWMKQHPQSKNTLSSLAKRALMSDSAFRQHFRTIVGISPMKFQKQLRLQQARVLILQEKRPIAEAASLVGYESPSQFSREYKRFFGVTAKEDRLE